MVGKSKTSPSRAASARKTEAEERKTNRRERRREQSREELLDAAERVLLREGLSNVTVDAVAQEVDLTKAALYYYFPSKDALLFEVVYRHMVAEAAAVKAAVEATTDGPGGLRAIIEATIAFYAPRMDAFRLVYLQGQVAGTIVKSDDMVARIRPLNELLYGAVQARLERDRARGTVREGVHPRRLAFLAHMAAIGLLTMKGLVEGAGDPLVHKDAELVRELGAAFANAARRES
jgi:AcrR family transcriptional regulator